MRPPARAGRAIRTIQPQVLSHAEIDFDPLKVFGFGGLMAVVALIIGAIGYWGMSRQATELSSVVNTSLAIRNHIEGDMMQYALRADVLSALRAAQRANKEEQAQVRADVADHATNFRERIAANNALPLNPEIKAAIAEVNPKLDAYIKSAEDMVALAEKDPAAAEAQYPAFLGVFEELEDARSSRLSDLMAPRRIGKAIRRRHHGLRHHHVIVAILAAVVGLGLAIFGMVRAICTPLNSMTSAMTTLAAGDHSIDVPARDRADEIGKMAGAMQVFKDNSIRAERLAGEQLKEHEARSKRAEVLETRAASFDVSVTRALKTVSSAATEMQSNAEALSHTAEQTTRQATAVASASEQASTNVQTVAAATEELSASISEISRQVSQSAKHRQPGGGGSRRTNDQVRRPCGSRRRRSATS